MSFGDGSGTVFRDFLSLATTGNNRKEWRERVGIETCLEAELSFIIILLQVAVSICSRSVHGLLFSFAGFC